MRGEVAGALRSVRYDLGRRPAQRNDGPDVTSTGLSTFPGSLMEWRTVPEKTGAKPRRRYLSVTALCLLALVGAIGSYLLVTYGLAAAADRPEAAPAPPPSASATPAESPSASPAAGEPTTRMGAAGPGARTTGTHRGAVAPRPAEAAHRPTGATKSTVTRKPIVPRPPAGTPKCNCVTPPVPTPTAPASVPAPAVTPPAVSESAPPGGSAEPSPDASDPSPRDGRRHRHRPWRNAG
ncbi:hypothetical protein Areg01_54180 [Actinoplanes regularis]|nr:hypothetical protein Areg01_54180 [Actinoplanes regularis]